MLKNLIRPWWANVLMGILLIICAILIFNNPEATMLAVAFWLGWLILIAGIAGIISYLYADKGEKSSGQLLSSILNLVFGFMMISKLVIAVKALTIVFGLVVLSNGLWLISAGWQVRKHSGLWWAAALLGLAAIFFGVKCIFNMEEVVEGMSNLIGIGILLSGIGLIILGIVKRGVGKVVKEKLQNLKEGIS